MANIITLSRIVLSVILLPVKAFSPLFYGLYILTGVTDMIDGTLARKTNSETKFGSKLDTLADIIFFAISLIKIFPFLNIPNFLWLGIGIITAIKFVNMISGYIAFKEFVTVHTLMNKITGIILFVLPFTLSFIELRYSGSIACAVAIFAAIQEGHSIRTGKIEYLQK